MYTFFVERQTDRDGQTAFNCMVRSLTLNYQFPKFFISLRASGIDASNKQLVKHNAKCVRFVQTVFMCFVWFSQQTAIIYKWMLQSVTTTL